MAPTLYLSNWSSHRTPNMHGPGRKLSIMASPRPWEYGAGRVDAVSPITSRLRRLMATAIADRSDEAAMIAYREAFDELLGVHLVLGFLAPWVDDDSGGLVAVGWSGTPRTSPVVDGDTLLCACSVAEAAAGRCHRAWIAPVLVRAGWRVVLDGAEVTLGS